MAFLFGHVKKMLYICGEFLYTLKMNAYFSNIRKEIIANLSTAQSEIKIAMAWFTSAELFDELIKCCHKGVSVNLLLLDDAINWMYYAPDFNLLKDAGANVRIVSRDYGMLHHKFCVIDQQIIITGSYNWTYYAETRNIENVVVIDDRLLANCYLKEFDELIEKTKPTNDFKRLSWEDINYENDLNIFEINQEIATIARERQLPEKQIVVTPAKVEIVEKKRTPLSAVNIGVQITKGSNTDAMRILIGKNQNLPETYCKTFYNYSDNRKNVKLNLYVGDSAYASQNRLILSRDLSEIIANSIIEELQIKIKTTLDTNGHLHVTAECIETQRMIDLTMTNPSFVCYAD